MFHSFLVSFLLSIFLLSCAHKLPQKEPQAKKIPHKMEIHGDVRIDPYFWLKNRENPEVIQYLEQENQYADQVMKLSDGLPTRLFEEMKSRIQEEDSSVPVLENGFYYSFRHEKGQQYPIYFRKKNPSIGASADEEILLNVNHLAKDHTYYKSTGPLVSPNSDLMAYGADTKGRRIYSFRFKDLKTGKDLEDELRDLSSNLVWANDNETVFYTKQHPETLRNFQIYRYNLKTKANDLVFEETDETFSVGVRKGSAQRFIYLVSYSTLSTETRYLDANNPNGEFKVFHPREKEHRYSLDETEDGFYILTNWNAKNYRLMKAPNFNIAKPAWRDVIPHRSNVYLENMQVFKNYFALEERIRGLVKLSVLNKKTLQRFEIPAQDSAYLAYFTENRDYHAETIKFHYESMRKPASILELNIQNRKIVELKQFPVPNYNPELYKSERFFVKVRDGKEVPVSLIMKKDAVLDGSSSGLIYGYGSYGNSLDPAFSANRISLIDRGFVFVIAHVRGGAELGRSWYDGGRTQNKMNTFNDFIDVTEWLVKNKYMHPKKVFAMGGSAGGLLMGAIANQRPELYRGIVAQVPFVDVLTTMLDTSIPLTTAEYDEWGNPNVKIDFLYIRKYSPYDNVTRQAYPHIYISTGLHDSQVQYWEPAKWIAKLRENKTNEAVFLMRTNMKAGHSGASGRFEPLKDLAESYAFILMMNREEELPR